MASVKDKVTEAIHEGYDKAKEGAHEVGDKAMRPPGTWVTRERKPVAP